MGAKRGHVREYVHGRCEYLSLLLNGVGMAGDGVGKVDPSVHLATVSDSEP